MGNSQKCLQCGHDHADYRGFCSTHCKDLYYDDKEIRDLEAEVKELQQQAIKRGYAQHNAQTGKFEWK